MMTSVELVIEMKDAACDSSDAPQETSYSLIPSIASHSRFLTTHLITMNPTWGLYLGKKSMEGVENTKVKKNTFENG